MSLFLFSSKILKNICLAVLLGSAAFVLTKSYLPLEYVLFFAIISFCADAVSTKVCTRNGFVEKNPLYIILRKKLSLNKSAIIYGIIYIAFVGIMYWFGMLLEGTALIIVIHGYCSISNTVTFLLFRRCSKDGKLPYIRKPYGSITLK